MSLAILSLKPDHDGAIAGIVDKKLAFSIEAEKNSVHPYSWIRAQTVISALQAMPCPPDVLCLGMERPFK
jgi:hydroxymethyl cephem carbamoyltransferase